MAYEFSVERKGTGRVVFGAAWCGRVRSGMAYEFSVVWLGMARSGEVW